MLPPLLIRKLTPRRRRDWLGVIPLQVLTPSVEVRGRVILSHGRSIPVSALLGLGQLFKHAPQCGWAKLEGWRIAMDALRRECLKCNARQFWLESFRKIEVARHTPVGAHGSYPDSP
eukprot:15443310-Alexandrium_andersonii.AAC.1